VIDLILKHLTVGNGKKISKINSLFLIHHFKTSTVKMLLRNCALEKLMNSIRVQPIHICEVKNYEKYYQTTYS